MLNRKYVIIHLIVGLVKMILNDLLCVKMSQYFTKPYEPFDGDINVKIYLLNYAKKADLNQQNLIQLV